MLTAKNNPYLSLGKILLEKGIISSNELEIALEEQNKTNGSLGDILLKLGFVEDAADFLPSVGEQLGVEFRRLHGKDIPSDVIGRIPAQIATFYKIIPVECHDRVLMVAAVNPRDAQMIDALGMIFPGMIKTVLASEKDVTEAIRRYYGVGAETIDRMMGSSDRIRSEEAGKVDDLSDLDSEASIGKFINQILLEAYKDRATDIHIEPCENRLQIRYRIDGVLRDAQVPPNIWHFRDSIASRIKIMSNLNIAERRLAQDGRFKVKVEDTELDLRVSFLPTQFGESIALRLLSSSKLYNLGQLGLDKQDLVLLNDLINLTHGIVFVTGPTGSGKTTTLYSCLAQLDRAENKIITIEDPIEYRLDGTTQIQVHPAIGLTFASGLRSMLRHDPDVMMVGEVRDLETAQIAVQIALTGHLVFSTLHTNDSASGVTRLIDMGVEPYLITSSVECFIAQRLIRLLCPKCKQPAQITDEIVKDFGLDVREASETKVFEGKGCAACNFTGYRGRQGVYEFFKFDDDIRRLIMARAPASVLKDAALKSGMRTMMQDGWRKIRAGITSPSEVMRVIRENG